MSIKESIAQDFRKFSKNLSKSQSMTLRVMLDFFEVNEISPMERLGPSNRTLESELKKRMNAIIAIIKSIEKSQTRPTAAMLESLFSQADYKEEEHLIVMKENVILDEAEFEKWDGKDF